MATIDTGKSAAVFGIGNIGSHAAAAIARMPEISRITLVDDDIYETKNLVSQAISAADVGKASLDAAADEIRRFRPDLEIRTFRERLENVPAGLLRADVIVGCLDSKAARRDLNRVAWRQGADFVDAGIEPASMLMRVGVFRPGNDGSCIQCGWTRAEYENIETAHACQNGAARPETNAPAHLGQTVAGLLAIEVQGLLAGGEDGAAEAFEVVVDPRNHRYFYTRFRRNPDCRFDHELARIERISDAPEKITLGELLGDGGWLETDGDAFVRELACTGCHRVKGILRLGRRLVGKDRCDTCGEAMLPMGFTAVERLSTAQLSPGECEISLADAGFLPGDVFRAGSPSGTTYHEFDA